VPGAQSSRQGLPNWRAALERRLSGRRAPSRPGFAEALPGDGGVLRGFAGRAIGPLAPPGLRGPFHLIHGRGLFPMAHYPGRFRRRRGLTRRHNPVRWDALRICHRQARSGAYLAVAPAFATDVLPDRSDVGKDLLAEPMPSRDTGGVGAGGRGDHEREFDGPAVRFLKPGGDLAVQAVLLVADQLDEQDSGVGGGGDHGAQHPGHRSATSTRAVRNSPTVARSFALFGAPLGGRGTANTVPRRHRTPTLSRLPSTARARPPRLRGVDLCHSVDRVSRCLR